MTVMPVAPSETAEWSLHDLDAWNPDDGLQYELLDGLLLVTPAPVPRHQRAVGRMFLLLHESCPAELEVFVAPLDWRPDESTSLQPDLLVVDRALVGEKNVTAPLALAVEVLSPSTRRKDLLLKRSKYEDCGVASFWVVEPDEPSVTAFDLVDGRYVEVGRASGRERVAMLRPFSVTVVPGDLLGPPSAAPAP